MRCRRKIRGRRGAATLELILVVPILLIVLIFSIQFGIVAIYQATVTHSATVAAREAGKGADFETILDVVQQVLDVHGIDMELPGTPEPDDIKLVLEDHGASNEEYGSLSCTLPGNALQSDQVRVTVCVDLSATRFCDALAPWGLTFAGRTFKASSLVMKEYEQDLGTP